jgi:aspartyl-tRNA(Asn)/glutamyl-tRNA(Gln) amidotransferase subunit A
MLFGGFPTTDATYYFRDYDPGVNADIVDDALRLGCVPLGKTNMHELALGATSAGSYFGPVLNPYDNERVAGGSSGGSAVAVARAKGPLLALGTDTGGSLRVPAALCGVVGFKPTLGTLSLGGVLPLSATLDHAGLLTRSVPDMIAAYEELTRSKVARAPSKMKVGILTGYYLEETEERVARDFWRALDLMEASGRFSLTRIPTDPGYARFTNARGAIQLKEAAWFYKELVDDEETASKMNPDVVTLLRRGQRFGDMRYLRAELGRLESIRVFGRMLKEVDLLATPTTRITAPKVKDVLGKEAGRLRVLLLQNLEIFNLCGFPALSIPSNPGAGTLPTGIQLVGGLGEDGSLLAASLLAAKAIA